MSINNSQAVMEEAELRLGEIRKSHYEFDRDIVKGAVNGQTSKVVAEKVCRYFEDKLRGRVSENLIHCNSAGFISFEYFVGRSLEITITCGNLCLLILTDLPKYIIVLLVMDKDSKVHRALLIFSS